MHDDDIDMELLDGIHIDRLNEMGLEEIEEEFLNGGNGDPERLRLLTYLLQRTSKVPSATLAPGAEVLERIETLPLPEVVRAYLTYQITFPSVNDLMNASNAPLVNSATTLAQ